MKFAIVVFIVIFFLSLIAGSSKPGRRRTTSGRNSRTKRKAFGSQRVRKQAEKVLKNHKRNQKNRNKEKRGKSEEDGVLMPNGMVFTKKEFEDWLKETEKKRQKTNIDRLLNNENWQ